MECFCVEREVNKILEIMKTEKENAQKSCWKKILDLYWLFVAALGVILIYKNISSLNDILLNEMEKITISDILGFGSVVAALLSVMISFVVFALEHIKQEEFFVIYRVKNYKELEVLISELLKKTKKEKIKIRDVNVFKHNNKTYLKIYY